MRYTNIFIGLACLVLIFSCSSDVDNVAEEKLIALMNDIEDNSDVCFREKSKAYSADSICIMHAIKEEEGVCQCVEYVLYMTSKGDEVFFIINLDQYPSILAQFQTLRKRYKMTDAQFEQGVKNACIAYNNANQKF